MAKNYSIPDDIEELKNDIENILKPIKPISEATLAEKDFLFSAQRTEAGRKLPEYYLCYFLFVELLQYKNLGQFEKIAWSVPIDYKEEAFLLEHRKLGFGLFAKNKESVEADEIVKLIHKAVRKAKPFFEWKAQESANSSHLNVINHNYKLFSRYNFFLGEYESKNKEAIERKDERIVTDHGEGRRSISIPSFELNRNAEWLALSAIDAFFSWTEHIFIHSAVLQGKAITGEQVANLAEAEWAEKFKAALDVSDSVVKQHYDTLVMIKRQIRNYVAHGAFGKQGEAFQIHSGAGAIPLLMPHQKGNSRFSFSSDLGFKEEEAIKAINSFIQFYWESGDFPEVNYLQNDLPTILTMAADGTYEKAMTSVEDMEHFVDYLVDLHDRSANMDW